MSDQARPDGVLADLREEPLSVDEAIAAVRDETCGALVVFVGLVRDHDHGVHVRDLDYLAHPIECERVREVCALVVSRFPQARVATSEAEIFADPDVRLVAAAAVPADRAAIGIRVMEAGKDYFTDKAPLTTLDQLAAVRDAVERTGRKYAVYYSDPDRVTLVRSAYG